MDWFENITGFKETRYEETQRRLVFREGHLVSTDGTAWSIGSLEVPSLADLRARAGSSTPGRGPIRVRCVAADVRALHAQAENRDALFQVASQFNLLEMVGPEVTPEHGVTRYQNDRTQGPACAIAAGAATIYRNYGVPLAAKHGQRAEAQIDCLTDLGRSLASDGAPLWEMRNGYALCTREGLQSIDRQLDNLDDEGRDALRGQLRIGLHWRVDVTDQPEPGHRVSQAFCSALPVAYSGIPARHWAGFASLVLEAAYEATLLAAVINRAEGGSDRVFLTRLGGGAFGNDDAWIESAIRRALERMRDADLDVRLVSYMSVPPELASLAHEFS